MGARAAMLWFAVLAARLGAQAGGVDPAGIPGALLLGGGGALPDGVYARFLELAGGKAGRIVLIPTASGTVDDEAGRAAVLARWRGDHPGFEFTLLHTRDRGVADTEGFCAPLHAATGVWFGGGAQERLAAAYLGTRVEGELHALLARGGVVGGTSAGTAIQSLVMIQEGRDVPVMARGFDLVPDAIVDQHFLKRARLPRLAQALADHAGLFGLGIDEGTAVELRGRDLVVHGVSKALLVLPAGAGRPPRIAELVAGERADLVTWQRAARDRSCPPWPPAAMAAPRVPHGALVIVGGGRIPAAVSARFLELAGGATAKVVVVPSAQPGADALADPIARLCRAAGAEVRVLDCAHPREVTAEKLAVLADATAVWFGGGRQWRLCDAFDGTPAIAAFHAVLARGGVIGGSSAGATIQGEFLVRGNPLGNTDEWCEGYDRGFGFLPGCAIDQHFLARDRTADLQGLVAKLPQLTGIGIDEGTAIVVQGSAFEVLGDSKVAVFDRNPEPKWLEPGARWQW